MAMLNNQRVYIYIYIDTDTYQHLTKSEDVFQTHPDLWTPQGETPRSLVEPTPQGGVCSETIG